MSSAAEKSETNKWVRLAQIVGVIAVLVFAGLGLSRTSALAVKTIAVEGNAHLTPQQVIAATSLTTGRSMVSVEAATLESRLEADPWVSEATVTRKWPTTVRISVAERVAIAAAQTDDGRWAEVAESGIVLSVVDSPSAGLPVILDQSVSATAGSQLSPEATSMVTLVTQLPDSLRPKVIQLQRDDKGEVRLGLNSGPIIELGQLDESLGNKLMAAATVVGKEDNKDIKVLDVRSPEFPLVTPVTTTTVAPPTTQVTAKSSDESEEDE